ncbi:uncharacterized protein [Rhodnius prolixus]|uniref:uncharacterized protein n=1 Tax=Rhodnius prolixus TaxID=13249 RepID=UPI003D188B87
MKYFLIFTWILLQFGISSLPQAKRIYFLHNNLGKINKKQIFVNITAFEEENEALNEPCPDKEIVLKRNAETQTASSADDAVKNVLSEEQLSKLPATFYYYQKTTKMACPPGKLAAPAYHNVECTYVPGKIICQLGRYNFVINNGDHYMDREVVEKFVIMAYQRYGEGDDFFDVAVDQKETTRCGCFEQDTEATTESKAAWSMPPVTIECDLVSDKKIKLCNPPLVPTEKIYQCRTITLGLKKRNTLHIGVSNDGIVSFIDDPVVSHQKVRKKREFSWPVSDETKNLNRRLRNGSSRDSNYYDEEGVTEESDLSNFYFHSKVPYVRNYTDICTLQYQFYPWCPEYRTDPCNNSTADSSPRPCRQAECTSTKQGSNETNGTTTMCTAEISTDEYFSRQTKRPKRKKRHKKNSRRRRRLKTPLKLGSDKTAIFSNKNKCSNPVRHSRQFVSDFNYEIDSEQNILPPKFQRPPRSTSSGISFLTTMPSYTKNCKLTKEKELMQQSDQHNEMLKQSSFNQLKEDSLKETLQYVGTENSLVQPIPNDCLTDIEGLEQSQEQPPQYVQESSRSNCELQSNYPKTIVRSDNYAKYPFHNDIDTSLIYRDAPNVDLFHHFRVQNRPKRRIIFRKFPRFRGKQLKQLMCNQVNAPSIYYK